MLKRKAEGDGRANVGPKSSAIHTNDCIPEVWQRHSSKGSPQQRRRWNESSRHVAARRAKRIADKNGSTTTQPTGQEKVQTGAVGRRHPSNPLTAAGHVPIVEIPVENDLGMSRRDFRDRQRRRRPGFSHQRSQSRAARRARDRRHDVQCRHQRFSHHG
jgi:hypothetical protein